MKCFSNHSTKHDDDREKSKPQYEATAGVKNSCFADGSIPHQIQTACTSCCGSVPHSESAMQAPAYGLSLSQPMSNQTLRHESVSRSESLPNLTPLLGFLPLGGPDYDFTPTQSRRIQSIDGLHPHFRILPSLQTPLMKLSPLRDNTTCLPKYSKPIDPTESTD